MAAPELSYENEQHSSPESLSAQSCKGNPFSANATMAAAAAEPELFRHDSHYQPLQHLSHPHHHAIAAFELYQQHLYSHEALRHPPVLHPYSSRHDDDESPCEDGHIRLSPISAGSVSPRSGHSTSHGASVYATPNAMRHAASYLEEIYGPGTKHFSGALNGNDGARFMTPMIHSPVPMDVDDKQASSIDKAAKGKAVVRTPINKTRRASTASSVGSVKSSTERKTTDRRAEQNRTAQRAFRERRQQYVKDLEVKAAEADTLDARLAEAETRLTDIQCLAERLAADRESWMRERELWWRERDEAVTVVGALVKELEETNKENQKFRELLLGLTAGKKRDDLGFVNLEDLLVDIEKPGKDGQVEESRNTRDDKTTDEDSRHDTDSERKSPESSKAHTIHDLLNTVSAADYTDSLRAPSAMAGGMAGIAHSPLEGYPPHPFENHLMIMDYQKMYQAATDKANAQSDSSA